MYYLLLDSISGISRICKIAVFSGDGLVKALLKSDKAINENAISAALKDLGQNGVRKLQVLLLSGNAEWSRESKLKNITLDSDSTVVPVKITRSGHQTEFKMYEHNFYKDAREELDRLIEAA